MCERACVIFSLRCQTCAIPITTNGQNTAAAASDASEAREQTNRFRAQTPPRRQHRNYGLHLLRTRVVRIHYLLPPAEKASNSKCGTCGATELHKCFHRQQVSCGHRMRRIRLRRSGSQTDVGDELIHSKEPENTEEQHDETAARLEKNRTILAHQTTCNIPKAASTSCHTTDRGSR